MVNLFLPNALICWTLRRKIDSKIVCKSCQEDLSLLSTSPSNQAYLDHCLTKIYVVLQFLVFDWIFKFRIMYSVHVKLDWPLYFCLNECIKWSENA